MRPMKKLELSAEMKKRGFVCATLAEEIGKLCERKPTGTAVWGWAKRGRRPIRKEWIKALAVIFNAEYGEEFFL